MLNQYQIETLKKYLDSRFKLYPCSYYKGYYNFCIKQYLKHSGKDNILHCVTNYQELFDVLNNGLTISGYNAERGIWATHLTNIEYFRIKPNENYFAVIDIDTHEGKENGYNNFEKWKRCNGIDYDCLDVNKHPCKVISPNGGTHLYFRLQKTREWQQKDYNDITEAVELKLNFITSGGSNRTLETEQGQRIKPYVLQGDLNHAPALPFEIIEHCKKASAPERPPRTFYNYEKKGRYTMQQCYEFTQRDHAGESTDKFLYYLAFRIGKEGYSKSEAKQFILNTQKNIERKDGDSRTLTTIDSAYSYLR